MSAPVDPQKVKVSAEDFLRLNRELAAIIRAGIPLELGLSRLSLDSTRGLGQLADAIQMHLAKGLSLEDALRNTTEYASGPYCALIAAGLMGNSLPEAFEGYARTGAVSQTMLHRLRLAVFYPVIILVVAAFLASFVIENVFPRAGLLGDAEDASSQIVLLPVHWLKDYGTLIVRGLFCLPFAYVGFCYFVCSFSSRRVRSGSWFIDALAASLPGITPILKDLAWARWCETLRLLVSQGMTLPNSLKLAGEATSIPSFMAQSEICAERLQKGESLRSVLEEGLGLPKVIRQSLQPTADRGELMCQTLEQLSQRYWKRMQTRLRWMEQTVPSILIVVVGGGVTLLFGLLVIGPLRMLWSSLETLL